MSETNSIPTISQNTSVSTADDKVGKLVDVFGGALKTMLSPSVDEHSDSAGLKDSVIDKIQSGGSSLLQLVSNIELPHSIEEIVNSPKFSALTEKFSFLDKLDIFEITQERFNELMEGFAE